MQYLGDLVFHAAAKDTRINPDNAKVYGVLDDRFDRTPAEPNPLNLGGANTLNQWLSNPSLWDPRWATSGAGQAGSRRFCRRGG